MEDVGRAKRDVMHSCYDCRACSDMRTIFQVDTVVFQLLFLYVCQSGSQGRGPGSWDGRLALTLFLPIEHHQAHESCVSSQ